MLSELPFSGHSMWPTLRSGDQILVDYFDEPKRISEFKVGEILLHRDGKEWVAHRVVKHNKRKVLKGDFSNSYLYETEPIIWGRVRGFRRDDVSRTWGERGPKWSKATANLSRISLDGKGPSRKVNKFLIYVLSRIQFLD